MQSSGDDARPGTGEGSALSGASAGAARRDASPTSRRARGPRATRYLWLLVLGLGPVRARSLPASTPGPLDLPDAGYAKGSSHAPVAIIEFVDFSCPACATFALHTMPQIERDWIATGRARLRVVPFDALRAGRAAARAAACAAEQGKFWPMHDSLFARSGEWRRRVMQYRFFDGFAAQIGLDLTRYEYCWKHNTGLEQFERNTALARGYGVPGTPAFFVNGRPLVGALPYSEFGPMLEAAEAGVASGRSPALSPTQGAAGSRLRSVR